MLPHPTLDQRVATGFLRNSMLNQEGGIEPEQFRTEAMIDRMDAIGKAWLGLTINCCQCHDHKYDPILQREYYQLFAFLNNDDEPFIEVPTPQQQKKREEIVSQVRELEDKAMHEATHLTERMSAWEKEIADAAGQWTVLEPKEWLNFATKYEKQSDYSLLAGHPRLGGHDAHEPDRVPSRSVDAPEPALWRTWPGGQRQLSAQGIHL